MLELFPQKVRFYRWILTFAVPLSACADIPDDTPLAAPALRAEVVPQADAGAPQVKLVDIVATGDGCKTGTIGVVLSADGTHAEARLPAYDVAIGPDRLPVDTKGCELRFVLRAPTGFYVTTRKSRFELDAEVDPAVEAKLSVRQTYPGAGSAGYLLNFPIESSGQGGGRRDVGFPTEPPLQQLSCATEQGLRLITSISLWDPTHTLRSAARVKSIHLDLADLDVRPCATP